LRTGENNKARKGKNIIQDADWQDYSDVSLKFREQELLKMPAMRASFPCGGNERWDEPFEKTINQFIVFEKAYHNNLKQVP